MTELVVDLDQHQCDLDLPIWGDLPSRYQPRRPQTVVVDGVDRLCIDDRLFPRPSGPGRGSPRGSGAGGRATLGERIAAMDRSAIAAGLLLGGNLGMAIHAVRDRQLRHQIAALYRRWSLSQAQASGGRLAVAALCDPLSLPAPAELANGAIVGLQLRPTNADRVRWFDDAMEPVLRLAADTGLPIVLHAGTGYYQDSPAADGYDNYFYTHLHSHTLEMELALAELVAGGIFRRYPGLRVAVVEAGLSWVPPFAARLEMHLRSLGSHVPGDGRPVREIFAQHCLFSVLEEDEEDLPFTLGRHPWLRACLGSDFPHWDAMDVGRILAPLSGAVRRAVASGNALEFFPRLAAFSLNVPPSDNGV